MGGVVLSAAALCAAEEVESEPRNANVRQTEVDSRVEDLIAGSDCRACHTLDRVLVGPAYSEVARQYEGRDDAVEELMGSIREGGSGRWGDIPMTPHPDLSDSDLEEIVTWILDQKDHVPTPNESETTRYAYTLGDGRTVDLDYQLFLEDDSGRVTEDVFRGYLYYNSYCYRCHGLDVTGSELAPDLRDSLEGGLMAQDFLATSMAGREAEGMPGWAGFMSEQDIRQILMYVEARRFELIPVGRPRSEIE